MFTNPMQYSLITVLVPQLAAVARVTHLAARRWGKISAATTQATGPMVEAKPATKMAENAIKDLPAD